MAPPKEPFHERRKNHALRALYQRVDTLEKVNADLTQQLTILEAGAVTFKWLMTVVIGLFVVSVGGAFALTGKVQDIATASEKRSGEASAALAQKVDEVMRDQADSKVMVKALYLVNVERQPREIAKEEAKR